MSDYSSDNSDDEYGPIVGAWGDQKGSNTTEDDTVLSGWHALADPNAKIGPKGLGSGGLHRQGKNYKPIEEEAILEQRKRTQVQGKKGSKKGTSSSSRGGKSKKLPDKKTSSSRTRPSSRKETNAKKSPTTTIRSSRSKAPPNNAPSQWSQWDPAQQQQQQQSPMNNNHASWMESSQSARSHGHSSTTSSRSTTTTRPPPSNGASSWGNQPLVDHPFWESVSFHPISLIQWD